MARFSRNAEDASARVLYLSMPRNMLKQTNILANSFSNSRFRDLPHLIRDEPPCCHPSAAPIDVDTPQGFVGRRLRLNSRPVAVPRLPHDSIAFADSPAKSTAHFQGI
jgi:hypothetical protein